MYTILISAALAIVVAAGGVALAWWGWIGGVFLGLLAFVITTAILGRRNVKRLQPQLERVRRLAESGQLDPAVRCLEELLPMSKWVPLLSGQLHAQIGVLSNHLGDESKAVEHLSKASRRLPEGQLMLASIHYRNERPDEAIATLAASSKRNLDHGLYQNVYAYLLHKQDRTAEAMAQLNRFLKKAPNHEVGKDNLLRLQNNQKMDLKSFGPEWYALGFERPPANMGELRTARKGFRQQPKRPQQKKQPKKKKRG